MNPPLAERPPLDYDQTEAGVVVFSAKDEEAIRDVAIAFTGRAWMLFSEWVSQTYEDGKVRWRVLEEANRR